MDIASYSYCNHLSQLDAEWGYLRIYVQKAELVMPHWAHVCHRHALGSVRVTFVALPHTYG